MPRRTAALLVLALSFVGTLACSDDGGGTPRDTADAGTDSGTTGDVAPTDLAGGADAEAPDGADDPDGTSEADGPTADGADDPAPDDARPDAPVHALLGGGFLNIAHRGGGRLEPEATLEAYRNAIAVGADVIEVDLHSTSDGVIVCLHDARVDRTTDGTGAVRSFSFDELRRLDAGFRFTRDGGQTFPRRGQGVVIPTFEEVLQAFPDTPIAIEIKQATPDITGDVIALIRQYEAEDRVVIASFADATIASVRAAAPDLVTALAAGEMVLFARLNDRSEATYVPPGEVVQAPAGDTITPALLARARRLGMKVHLWTINDRAEMEQFLGLGVDGIFTDDPALLNEVLAR